MITENKRVLLGMSGGTDSSVAAMLLQDAGYEVTGLTFRFHELNDSTEYLEDAKTLCNSLGIKHIVYDARSAFKKFIIDYFINEYMEGRTPVPCVLCNNQMKWPLLAQIANEHGIYHIATGHYAQKTERAGKYYITAADDTDKDQSFFLWGFTQEILRRAVFPMGNMTKVAAREFAGKRGFTKAAQKKDSMGVCFCPFDYRSFLRKHLPPESFQKGRFVDEEGKFIGLHEGYPFYTIGQRRGLGIHLNRAVFVKDIDIHKNEIVLSSLKALEKSSMILKDWNIVDEKELLNRDDVIVKIRYRKQANTCRVIIGEDGNLQVKLFEPLTAIAAGQAATFYRDNCVLGGGIIV